MDMNEASEPSGMLTSGSVDRWRTCVSVREDAMCQILDKKSAMEFSLVPEPRMHNLFRTGAKTIETCYRDGTYTIPC